MNKPSDVVSENLDACRILLERFERELTAWEIDFLQNIEPLLEAGHGLSPNRQRALDEIWERLVVRNPERNRRR